MLERHLHMLHMLASCIYIGEIPVMLFTLDEKKN